MIQRNIWRWMILDINGREKAKRFWIVASLLGICMFVTAIFCFFHTEKNEAEKRMVEIVNYVKVQCSTYTHYNESSESKSLLRAIESARQMSTNIDMEVKNRKRICSHSGWMVFLYWMKKERKSVNTVWMKV